MPIYSKGEYITITSVPYLCEDDQGILMLKRDHCYFYQVQGILLCSDRSWCDFVIWTFRDIKVIRIIKDDEFICEMREKLASFFEQYFRIIL